IETEDKRIQNRVLGALDLRIVDGTLGEVGDLFIERLNGLDGRLALRHYHQPQHSGMIPAGAHSAADSVGEPLSGANVVKQPGRKSSAEGLVEHRGREIIRSVA